MSIEVVQFRASMFCGRSDWLPPRRFTSSSSARTHSSSDSSHLYGPPDGYVDAKGIFHKQRVDPADKPVYEIEMVPADGLYPMPYMARQADGTAWEDECAVPYAPDENARQGFFPDGARSFEEIDRLQISGDGVGNLLSDFADFDFYRAMPPAGYRKGQPAANRQD